MTLKQYRKKVHLMFVPRSLLYLETYNGTLDGTFLKTDFLKIYVFQKDLH